MFRPVIAMTTVSGRAEGIKGQYKHGVSGILPAARGLAASPALGDRAVEDFEGKFGGRSNNPAFVHRIDSDEIAGRRLCEHYRDSLDGNEVRHF